MAKKVVVVLEDSDVRVQWLRDLMEPLGFEVRAHDHVQQFLRLVKDAGIRLTGVVLDHDLGGYRMPISLQDGDGLDGLDAAEKMPATVPTLVWSTNHIEAPKMVETL